MCKLLLLFVLLVGLQEIVCRHRQTESQCCPTGYRLTLTNSSVRCRELSSNKTIHTPLTCEDITVLTQQDDDFYFTVNKYGDLVLGPYPNREPPKLERGTFCIIHQNKKVNNEIKFSRLVAMCSDNKKEKIFHKEVYGYCMLVSSLFLLVTAIVYSKPKLRDLHGLSVINFSGSLSFAYGILAAMKILQYSDMTFCAIRGMFAYFFIVAAFFWMSALALQSLLNVMHPTHNSREHKKFLWYSLFCWGSASALTVLLACINFAPGDHLKPGIGLNNCWFFDSRQEWWYFYSVLSVLNVLNICLFIITTVKVCYSYSQSESSKYKFLTMLRLFVITGVLFIFEIVSSKIPGNAFWDVMDLVNSLQGVLIFIVLVLFPYQRPDHDEEDATHLHDNLTINCIYKR